MNIEVLGTGCPTCKELMKKVEEVVLELNIPSSVEKVEDIQKIMSYGIMTVPALVVDKEVIFFGKSPKKEELKEIFLKRL